MVTHQLQVERRTGKVRRPETDVLPLSHATNLVAVQSFYLLKQLGGSCDHFPSASHLMELTSLGAFVVPPRHLSRDTFHQSTELGHRVTRYEVTGSRVSTGSLDRFVYRVYITKGLLTARETLYVN